MTDLGGGYSPQNDQQWYPGDPGHGGQQPQRTGAWQQQGDPQQQGWPQQADPFGQQQPRPQYGQQQGYPQQQGWPQQADPFGQQQPRPQYGQQQGYPQQPQQPQYRQPFPQQQVPQQPFHQQQPLQQQPSSLGPDGIDWEAEAAALDGPPVEPEPEAEQWEEQAAEDEYQEYEEPEHSFFSGDEDDSRDGERKRKEQGKKAGRRNRGACLLVALVLLGGMGGAGWWGYGFYKQHFGPPPDYVGEGTGTVNIQIKDGASGGDIAATLKDADVVKSLKAFTVAYGKNSKAITIQPGTYTLHHEMSGAAAVQSLVESNGGNALVIPEGKKASEIYAKIDTKLKLAAGTTANVAKTQVNTLGLPDYAQGNIEGFLYPTRYSITDGMKPEDLLKQMVTNAVQHYQQLNLDAGAPKIGLKKGYEVIIEASILQAEGNNSQDFGKMARAIYNRLNTNTATYHHLQLDTTLQYQLGRTALTDKEINDASLSYNTNMHTGLPPGPIGNPGDDAINAVLNPTPGDWVYWIAMSPTETRFAVTWDEHLKNVQEYCGTRNLGFDAKRGQCK